MRVFRFSLLNIETNEIKSWNLARVPQTLRVGACHNPLCEAWAVLKTLKSFEPAESPVLSRSHTGVLSSFCVGLGNGASPLLSAPDPAAALLLPVGHMAAPSNLLSAAFSEWETPKTNVLLCWSQRYFFWLSDSRRGSRVWTRIFVFLLFVFVDRCCQERRGRKCAPALLSSCQSNKCNVSRRCTCDGDRALCGDSTGKYPHLRISPYLHRFVNLRVK